MSKQWLRSKIERGAQGVDRELKHENGTGAVLGFAVLTKGPINEGDARDWEFDDISLEQVVNFGNTAKKGIKSRFGHPNMSGDALGTFLGRVKNFRRDGDIVRADLFFDKTAYDTPDGNLADYVMGLAENDPDAFGTSMVFDAELETRLNSDGTTKKDEKEHPLPALVRFKKLFATDVVDDPAANKGMFGSFISGNAQLSAEMTSFLDRFLNNPDAVEKTIKFLERYQINRDEFEERVNKKEEVEMSLKELTIEALKSERPDLIAALHAEGLEAGKSDIEKTAKEAATKVEKERIIGILGKAKAYQNVDELAQKCIEDGDSIEVVEGKFKDAKLAALSAAAPATPGPGNPEGASGVELSLEEKCEQEFKASKDLQDEFKELSTYTAFKKAESQGKVKILKK